MKNKFIIFCILFLISCAKQEKEEIAYPVNVQRIIMKDSFPIYIETIGHVEAINSVNVRSQVEGVLKKIHFKQGDYVNKNDLLFTIDPRPYKIALKKAKAELEQNIANLYIAQDKLRRNEPLLKYNYISELDLETLKANVLEIQALIKQNEADIENAEVNLKYCYIYSPINGKSGVLKITKGNLITKNGNPIISIKQISPIFVTFSIAQDEFKRIKKEDEIILKSNMGKLKIIDNKIDKDLSMITVKATFENFKKNLWPGQFVKIKLIEKTEKNALIIPKKAVLVTDSGKKVFILKGNKAILKDVILGQEDKNFVLVKKGLSKEDIIITQGIINLSNNSKVYVETTSSKKAIE